MSSTFRGTSSPAPVMVQITELERRILDERRSLSLRAAALDRAIRRRLSSPTTLLLAAGAGFIGGKLTEGHAPKGTKGARGADGSAAPGLGALDTALNVFTLVSRIWRAMSPAAQATADPPSQCRSEASQIGR